MDKSSHEWGSGRTRLAVTQVPLCGRARSNRLPRAPNQLLDPEREGQRTGLLIPEVSVRARVGPPINHRPRGSSDTDATPSRWKDGFDSRTRRHLSTGAWPSGRRRLVLSEEFHRWFESNRPCQGCSLFVVLAAHVPRPANGSPKPAGSVRFDSAAAISLRGCLGWV